MRKEFEYFNRKNEKNIKNKNYNKTIEFIYEFYNMYNCIRFLFHSYNLFFFKNVMYEFLEKICKIERHKKKINLIGKSFFIFICLNAKKS